MLIFLKKNSQPLLPLMFNLTPPQLSFLSIFEQFSNLYKYELLISFCKLSFTANVENLLHEANFQFFKYF